MTERPIVRFLDRTTPPHVFTLVLMAGLGALNMSALLPSLPHMTTYFETRYDVIQLSVSLYLGVNAVLQLIIGPIADRYGRRVVTLWCYAIFLVATLGCLFAQTIEVFLAFRMIQGAVVVGFVLSRAIVRDMHSQDDAASMIGYVTMGMAMIPMIAPMIGGALDEAFGWHAVFWFILVAGIAVTAICWADLGETNRGGGVSFSQQFQDYPELFTSRRFWGYVISSAFSSGTFFAYLGGGPYVASTVFGLSSFWAGVYLGAPSVGYAVGNYISGRYSATFGVNWMVRTGAAVTTVALGVSILITATGFAPEAVFFIASVFVGLGNGMVIPNASAGMLSVRPHLAGTASGLGSACMIGGGAVLSVFSGFMIQRGGGSLTLLIIMFISVLFGLLSILYVIRREAQLEGADA